MKGIFSRPMEVQWYRCCYLTAAIFNCANRLQIRTEIPGENERGSSLCE